MKKNFYTCQFIIVNSILTQIIDLRHWLHQFPETAFKEINTSAKIDEILKAAGLTESRTMASTGKVYDIRGTASEAPNKRIIALRADMDALPMQEENHDLPYRSQNSSIMHACGHDGHMSVLIGAALLFLSVRHKIPSNHTIRLLFQPAEEGPGGALPMIAEGCLDGVDEVYGFHNWPQLPVGHIAVKDGPVMARVTPLEITVRGRGGHSSQPHANIDPVLTACHCVVAINSIVSRNIKSSDNAVISVTAIHGGTANNVIPDTVSMIGTIRTLTEESYQIIDKRMHEVVEHTAAAYGASADVKLIELYPPLINHKEPSKHVERIAKKLFGDEMVSDAGLPIMASEDFSFFTQRVPGCFFFVGMTEDGQTVYPCHSTSYQFNDKIIAPVIKIYIRLIEDRLGVSLFE